MGIRKKDFQRVVVDVKDFLSKLRGNDTTELRDALNFSLLHLHKYYKKLRHKVKNVPLLDGSLSLTSSLNSFTPASPYFPAVDKFDWRWINLDASKLSASFGHGDSSNLLPEIFYVLKNADYEKLEEILEADSDSVNEVDALGRSTALYCIHGKTNEHFKCLQLLIKYGVDLQQEASDGLTCYHLAAIMNYDEVIDILIDKNIGLNSEDNEGRYPLHLAAAYSSENILNKMLNAGADKNALDNEEMTPVMWACYFDRYENLELLLNITDDDEMKFETIDAELQDKDVNGKNVLHWCVSKSTNKECFKVLFSSNYSNITDDDGRNILHTIAEQGAIGVVDDYFDCCNNTLLNSLDNKDHTPLHLACKNGHGEMVDVLLSRGASLDLVDKNGMKPFDYAKAKNLNYCMLVMLSHEKYREKTTTTTTKMKGNEHSNSLTTTKKLKEISKTKTASSEHVQSNVAGDTNTPNLKNAPKQSKTVPDKVQKPSSPLPLVDRTSRKSSFSSNFDVQEDHVNEIEDEEGEKEEELDEEVTKTNQKKTVLGSKNNTKGSTNDTGDIDEEHMIDQSSLDGDDVEMNFNDQLIVLVEHHGSDDELVINTGFGNASENSEDDDVNNDDDGDDDDDDVELFRPTNHHYDVHVDEEHDDNDDDHDLLDAAPFARNGSITTVGVVSEGSMAFNSVSVNPSVSSLISSDEDSQRLQNENKTKSSSLSSSQQRQQQQQQQQQQQRSKSLQKQRNITSPLIPPPNLTVSPTSSSVNYTAPIPPPTQFYQNQNVTSETLIINPGDEKSDRQVSQRNLQKPRRQSPPDQRSQQLDRRSPSELTLPLKPQPRPRSRSPNAMKSKQKTRKSPGGNSGDQLSPHGTKLAPLQTIPRPPSSF